jgi:hypothetical protein
MALPYQHAGARRLQRDDLVASLTAPHHAPRFGLAG